MVLEVVEVGKSDFATPKHLRFHRVSKLVEYLQCAGFGSSRCPGTPRLCGDWCLDLLGTFPRLAISCS